MKDDLDKHLRDAADLTVDLQTSLDAYLEANNFARDPGTVAMAMGRWLIQQIARIEARLEAIERADEAKGA